MTDTQTENLYLNQGEHFDVREEPQEQKRERQKEKAKTLAALPLLKDLTKHFEDRIQFYKQIDSINPATQLKPEEFMHAVSANRLVVSNLEQELDYLNGLEEEHAK